MAANDKIFAAIVPNIRLGDGLVYMIIAKNLTRAGLSVSYYSDKMYEMRSWFPDMTISKSPRDHATFKRILDSHQYTVVDTPIIRDFKLDSAEWDSLVVLTPADPVESPETPHNEFETGHASDIEFHMELLRRKRCTSLCTEANPTGSLVDHTVEFCRNRLGIESANAELEIEIPDHLAHRANKQRIAVFPTTPIAKKQYPKDDFLRLTAALARKGWEPVVVVTPAEVRAWGGSGSESPISTFDNIESLAAFIYESNLIVSNDSGGGHLASLLGVPTITISPHRNPFLWRPGWSNAVTIGPAIKLTWFNQNIWAPFISQRKILRTVECLARASSPPAE